MRLRRNGTERAIYKEIMRETYEFGQARTFAPDEKEHFDNAVRRAIKRTWLYARIDHINDTIFRRSSSGTAHTFLHELGDRGILNPPLEHDTKIVGGDHEVVRQVLVGIICKEIKRANLRGADYLLHYLKIEHTEPRVEDAALELIKARLADGDVASAKEILRHIKVSKGRLGELLVELGPELNKRKKFYDPVKIGEMLGISREHMQQVADSYYASLRRNGNKVGAAVVGREADEDESELGPLQLDAYRSLLRQGNYPDAATFAEQELRDKELSSVAATLARRIK
ncbi:MAG: hypothetical protein KGH72_03370 [Candidatus Micrarchaeota archaeon]|nr:hypothetical protein [Candidatus Micrarchaeota archaeon]